VKFLNSVAGKEFLERQENEQQCLIMLNYLEEEHDREEIVEPVSLQEEVFF